MHRILFQLTIWADYYALQITFRLSPVQIVNFLCPFDEISVIRASIEHKKLTI
jgi:hypothetical protein